MNKITFYSSWYLKTCVHFVVRRSHNIKTLSEQPRPPVKLGPEEVDCPAEEQTESARHQPIGTENTSPSLIKTQRKLNRSPNIRQRGTNLGILRTTLHKPARLSLYKLRTSVKGTAVEGCKHSHWSLFMTLIDHWSATFQYSSTYMIRHT